MLATLLIQATSFQNILFGVINIIINNCVQVPTILEWLKNELSAGSIVGVDPRLMPADSFIQYEKDLQGLYLFFFDKTILNILVI